MKLLTRRTPPRARKFTRAAHGRPDGAGGALAGFPVEIRTELQHLLLAMSCSASPAVRLSVAKHMATSCASWGSTE